MITIPNITILQLQSLEQKLQYSHTADLEINTDGVSGTITGHGVSANFVLVAENLNVTVTKHPFFMPLGTVESAIISNITKALVDNS